VSGADISIGYCAKAEVPALCQYLRRYWASDHVLAIDRALLDWQHFDPSRERYNYVLAWRDGDALPAGVLGFIPTARYDAGLADQNTLWLALWSVREDVRVGGLGIRLLNFALRAQPHEAFGTIGISQATETLLRAYGCTAGVMNHHYMPAAHRTAFAIMKPSVAWAAPAERAGVSLVPLAREEVVALDGRLDAKDRMTIKPTKSATYFANRYFDHPSFDYTVWALHRCAKVIGLMASRLAHANGSRALRIVDYFGPQDGFVGCSDALQDWLRREDAEYADLLNFGLPAESMRRAGFLLKGPEDGAVVPDYFEPFDPRNIIKRFVFKPPAGAGFVLFKADADQDRPNLPRVREGDVNRDHL
jgi:hypothetical protein